MVSLLVGGPLVVMASSSSALAPSLSFSKSQSLICAPSSISAMASAGFRPASLLYSKQDVSISGSGFSVYCGRGDKKTARGKRFKHSFGNARPKDKTKGRGPPRVPAPPLPPRKDKYDDGTVVRIEIDESSLN